VVYTYQFNVEWLKDPFTKSGYSRNEDFAHSKCCQITPKKACHCDI